MTYENAERSPQSAAAIHSGLRLVYSRDWPKERRMRTVAQHTLQPVQRQPAPAPAKRATVLSDTLYLGAAALAAPILWAVHAVLRHMHVL